jgi:hypothetical protein
MPVCWLEFGIYPKGAAKLDQEFQLFPSILEQMLS